MLHQLELQELSNLAAQACFKILLLFDGDARSLNDDNKTSSSTISLNLTLTHRGNRKSPHQNGRRGRCRAR